MRMPILEFLANGDLKFVIIFYALLITAIIYFFKKLKARECQETYNSKIKKLFYWCILLSIFSLLLGLLHSFYFISKTNNIANNLLFRGFANMLITPTHGVIIAIIIIKFFNINLNSKVKKSKLQSS
ncbi:hypothetical protein [Polaribacter porphyrae]|uniref:MotA/TolQ/ExbB proton channel domain-containing protein n=1 Tax=Polaribacter porphyrae TaxID=1137780 RepID=A0A2S7WTY3_9FLAO|nr:hypothetical protein [Polaribacter porphyrae]PQJ80781.1 hypothetical protein BTO18_17085 [Polaribacter porphyrae]